MEFEAYKHHIFFILIVVAAGLILQSIVHRLIISLYPENRRISGKTKNNTHGFFAMIGKIFSWTASLYLGCRMYYVNIFPGELFSFLRVVLKMESVVLIMFFLSHGINHILFNIAANRKTESDGSILSSTTAKKTAKMPVKEPLSWILAFIVAAMGLNVIYFSSLINLLIFAALILFAVIFLYRSSEGGHQLVTGFIGYFYLKDEQKSRGTDEPFLLLLEDGKPYEVNKISLFHTSFKTDSNITMIRNNASLMILNYGFKEFRSQPDAGTQKYPYEKTEKPQGKENDVKRFAND